MKEFYLYIKSIEDIFNNENCEIIETESYYQLMNEISRDQLKAFFESGLKDIFNYFENSLTITINIMNIDSSVFKLSKGMEYIESEIQSIIDGYKEVKIIIHINKNSYLESQLIENLNRLYKVVIFSSTDNLVNYIKDNSIFYLQKNLYNLDKGLIILLPDIEKSYSNLGTHIISTNNVESLKEVSFPLEPIDSLDEIGKRARLRNGDIPRDEELFLSPDHLYFKDIDQKDLGKVLNFKASECIIIYLANSTKVTNSQYTCIFNGYKSASISLNENNFLQCLNTNKLYELYNWTFQSNYVDKIMIVRNIISKFLKDDINNNYCELIYNIEDILNSCQANYSVFFQKSIDAFFEDRKKIAQYTFDKTKEVEKEINNITDAMVKNVITAIGVILAAIIANSTRSGMSEKGIKIALASYLFYLFVSLFYNLINPVITLFQQCAGNSHLIQYFTTFVPKDEIRRIQGNVFRNKLILFWFYWGFSLLLMLALIIMSIYSIYHVNDLLKMI